MLVTREWRLGVFILECFFVVVLPRATSINVHLKYISLCDNPYLAVALTVSFQMTQVSVLI